MVSELRENGESGLIREAGIEAIHHWVVLETETARGAGGDVMIVHWKMAVAVRVGAGWSDMGRIEDVCIDEGKLKPR